MFTTELIVPSTMQVAESDLDNFLRDLQWAGLPSG